MLSSPGRTGRTPRDGSIRSWWEGVPAIHGDIHIYTSEGQVGKREYRWIEFRVRFTNGRVQDVREVRRKRIRRSARRMTKSGGSVRGRQLVAK